VAEWTEPEPEPEQMVRLTDTFLTESQQLLLELQFQLEDSCV